MLTPTVPRREAPVYLAVDALGRCESLAEREVTRAMGDLWGAEVIPANMHAHMLSCLPRPHV